MQVSDGYVLCTRGFTLFVDARYAEAATRNVRSGVRVKPLAALEKELAKVPVCGFEADDVSVSRKTSWKLRFPRTKFVPLSGGVEEFRRQKDEGELKLIRRAHRITEELLRRVPSALRIGISETELAWRLETWAHELGAERMSFPTIVGFGTHTSHPHHAPGSRKLRKGDIVQVDVGAVYKGYCADRSQVYFTAEPTKKQAGALRAVEEAKNAAIDAVVPGVSTAELDRIARSVLRTHGMEEAFTHSLGHGVGLDIHEGVVLSMRRPEQSLLKGEVITIEPGVYFPGSFGIRLEEMVIVR